MTTGRRNSVVLGSDSYDISAKHYDAAYAKLAEKQVLVDAPFYVEMARRSGGPVLEIGCGTGRVLLTIAREGIDVEGVTILPRCCAFAGAS